LRFFRQRGYAAESCQSLAAEMGLTMEAFQRAIYQTGSLVREGYGVFEADLFDQAFQVLRSKRSPVIRVRQVMRMWANYYAETAAKSECAAFLISTYDGIAAMAFGGSPPADIQASVEFALHAVD
ncbi:MAG: hypothetical protein MI861_13635, partial [Pirellulales bacterium]|nr:hypothetical protein [Pirellulales bacterium]